MGMLDLFRLDGKVALVTGTSRGLGQAMAVALAEAGADIAALDRSAYHPAPRQSVEGLGRRFAQISCNLRSASVEDLREAVAETVESLGRVDILVNNAGAILRGLALEFSEADWDEVLQVDLKALFFLSQAAAQQMVKQGGGKIIHIASVLSFQGGIRTPAYAAAKSGVAGLTRAMANEWAMYNINVNAIAPGYMVTDNTQALRANPDRNRAILERIPAGHWGVPDDLRGAVVYLASPASSYVHGAILAVDGGWLAR
jgi:2-dehydro-3-deoxy-D-gluconate 5-dehydrogenase